MVSDVKSSTSEAVVTPVVSGRQSENRRGWLKVGAIAAASAVLGGVAAAWYYRKTLSQLREAEDEDPSAETGITEDGSAEDF